MLRESPLRGNGLWVAGGKEARFDGVSGISNDPRESPPISEGRLRFEMSPVDMKAAGNGFAMLYDEDCSWLADGVEGI